MAISLVQATAIFVNALPCRLHLKHVFVISTFLQNDLLALIFPKKVCVFLLKGIYFLPLFKVLLNFSCKIKIS